MKKLFKILPLYFFILSLQWSIAAVKDNKTSKDLSSGSCNNYLFEENKHQWDAKVKYQISLNKGLSVFLENSGFMYDFRNIDDIQALMGHSHNHESEARSSNHNEGEKTVRHHAVKAEFIGSNPNHTYLNEEASSSQSNYYLGNDPAKWVTGVKSYKKVTYKELYKGIDMQLYCDEQNIKYDLIVAPNTDPSIIQLQYTGADKIYLSKGNLFVITSLGNIQELKPYAYQETGRSLAEIPCNYVLDNNILTYQFPKGYDKTKPLIIDPVLIASTYTGSTTDNWGVTGTYDKDGNIYAGGTVIGNGYPVTTGAYIKTYQGGASGINPGDIGLTVFTADGANQIYATYFGGSNDDRGHSMYVNDSGELYILGVTYSVNMPLAGTPYDGSYNNNGDIFVAKFNTSGQLTAFTYLGGSQRDGENTKHNNGAQTGGLMHNYGDNARGEIVIDDAGDVIIVSSTASNNFPVVSAFQTNLGGNQDACVAKLSSNLSNLIWSSYLGGNSEDAGYALTLGENNSVYVVGGTKSNNFPTTAGTIHPTSPGVTDGFVTRISSSGNTILASTYLGTSGYDQAFFVQTNYNNEIYVLGQTKGNYPVQSAPGKSVYTNAGSSQFIHKLSVDLDNTIFSTVIGNGSLTPNISPTAFLVDTCGYIYLSGWGRCDNGGSFGHASVGAGGVGGMPITPDAYQSTTDNCDFYLMVLGRDAEELRYGTYFGQNGVIDHVDGGTSRFDKRGVVYQSVCASCGGSASGFPVTAGAYSTTNRSFNCNNAIFKLDFEQHLEAIADVDANSGCAPHTVIFTNNSSGAKKYIWDFGDGTVDTTATPTHTYVNPGTYTIQLIAIDSSSCLISDTTNITIQVYGGDLVAHEDTSICIGVPVQLHAVTSADSVLWIPAIGLDNPKIKDPTASPSSTTTYKVYAYKNGCIAEDSVTVSIVTNPTSDFNASTVCLGDSTIFTDLSSVGVTKWEWNFGDGTKSSLQNPKHVYKTARSFAVKLKVSLGTACEDSITKTIIVTPLPVADFDVSNVCLGTPISLNNKSTGAITSWNWNFGDGNTTTMANPTHTYGTAGTYSIQLIANIGVCSGALTKKVTVIPALSARFAANDVCEDSPVVFNDLSNPQSYINSWFWDFGDGTTSLNQTPIHPYNSPGTYNVKLKIAYNNGGLSCPDSIVQQVIIGETPKVSIVANDACLGNEIQFINNTSGPVNTQWEWLMGDGTTSTVKDPLHTYGTSGTFIVKLTASTTNGSVTCSNSNTAAINVVPLPTANFTAEDVCEGVPVQFRDLSIDPLFIKGWEWNFGDGTMSTEKNPVHYFKHHGNYPVTLNVFTKWGTTICSNTKTDTVSVFPKPMAAFNVNPISGYANDPNIKITDLSIGGSSGIWNFGDKSSASYKNSEKNLTHYYSSVSNNKIGPFKFPITLILKSENGCTDTAKNSVEFITEWSFFVPNSFTPNGDGLNDHFNGKALGIIDYKMEIFNRWGELVFKSKDVSEFWDGTSLNDGKIVKQDVYVWKVWLRNNLGETHKYMGHVTLLK